MSASGLAKESVVTSLTQRWGYLALRVLQIFPTLFLIATINFALLKLAPGDAADVLAGEAGAATPEYISALRAKFQLDRSIPLQLAAYLNNLAHLDLGYSFREGMPVSSIIYARLGPTLLLMSCALIMAISFGTSLGVLASRRPNGWFDNLCSVIGLAAYSTPVFWIGLMFIVVFSIKLNWVPTSGMETVLSTKEGWGRALDIGHHLILPAVTLSLLYLVVYMRLMRAAMLEQANMDYVTTARAKGLSEWQIMIWHVLRNAILPVLTMIAIQAPNLIGGSVVVETVFGWPGIGLLAFDALFSRDLNLLLSIFFVTACIVVVVNLAVDLAYTLVDPRIKLR